AGRLVDVAPADEQRGSAGVLRCDRIVIHGSSVCPILVCARTAGGAARSGGHCRGAASRGSRDWQTDPTMATTPELARYYTTLDAGAIDHLQRLVAGWGLLADICFADLLLWARVDPGRKVPGVAEE